MESNDVLKYADETDKSFGLAGMAISLMAWDAEEWLEAIDLDANADEAMCMSTEFYLTIAPRVGAKALWEQSLKRFQLTAAMTVANVACRQMVHKGHASMPGDADSALRSALSDEGAHLCSLEDDEVSRVYGKSLAYCGRLFTHPGVKKNAGLLAPQLRSRRPLSAAEVFDVLAPLNRM